MPRCINDLESIHSLIFGIESPQDLKKHLKTDLILRFEAPFCSPLCCLDEFVTGSSYSPGTKKLRLLSECGLLERKKLDPISLLVPENIELCSFQSFNFLWSPSKSKFVELWRVTCLDRKSDLMSFGGV